MLPFKKRMHTVNMTLKSCTHSVASYSSQQVAPGEPQLQQITSQHEATCENAEDQAVTPKNSDK